MNILKIFSCFIGAISLAWLQALSGLLAQTQLDSLKTTPVTDTLVNFNRLVGGITAVTLPGEQTLPKGISLTPDGSLLGSYESLMALRDPLFFKLETASGDFYEVSLSGRQQSGKNFVLIQSNLIEMATGWRRDGKIWVVVASALLVFFAIIGFLLYLERRLRKVEKSDHA